MPSGQQISVSATFAGLRRYAQHNQGRSVATRDVQQAFERASGRDLGGFFAQWFEAPGHPELRVEWSFDAGRKRVELRVEQTQSAEGGVPAAYEADVEVAIATARGIERRRVALRQRQHALRLRPVRDMKARAPRALTPADP